MGKIFDFFSNNKNKDKDRNDDIGVTKEQVEKEKKLGFSTFFKLLRRSFGKLTGLNLIIVLCNFPILLFLYGLSGNLNPTINAPVNPLFVQLYGIMQNEISPLTASLNGIVGITTEVQIITTASKILMYSGLLLIFTLGISSIGMSYVMRNIVRSEYVSVWHDFFGAIKKNFKQGIVLSILDGVVILLLAYDIVAYSANSGDFVMNIFYFSIILISIIYFIMRYYMYIMVVTFDLKLKKIIKNSFLLSILGFRRNLSAVLGSVFLIVLSLYIYVLLPTTGILLPFIFTISLINFIGIYCVYPIIVKYMVEPYYDEHPDEKPNIPDQEPIL